MNANITFVELVDLMAKATSTSKRVCELFLKDLFAVVSQALIDGENVKIKGVGTFKITQVKPRKSVNVNTGAEMTVTGYNKVTFTPDKALAEAVNQPFAQFETVLLDDAVTDEKLAEIDEQHPSAVTLDPTPEKPKEDVSVSAEPQPLAAIRQESDQQVEEEPIYGESEIPVAPLPFELPQMQDAAPAPTPDVLFDSPELDNNGGMASVVEKPVREEPAKVEPVKAEPVKVEPVKEVKPQPKKEEKMPVRKPVLVGRPIDGPSQPVPEQEKAEEVNTDRHFYRPEPRNAYTPTPEQIEEATRKPDRRWLWLLLSALAIILMFWIMARSCDDSQAEVPEQEVVAADTVADEDITENDKVTDKSEAQTKPEQVAESKPEPKPEAKPEPKPEVKPEAKPEVKSEPKPESKPAASKTKEVTDVVTSQIVLTTLSEKHYGSPWFWVYIYEENVARGIINDPNNIKPGTRVVIPPASKYGINPNDKASLKKAQIKSMEYLKGR